VHDLSLRDERRTLGATHRELDEPTGADAAPDRAVGTRRQFQDLVERGPQPRLLRVGDPAAVCVDRAGAE
jgi:hypothetical protein